MDTKYQHDWLVGYYDNTIGNFESFIANRTHLNIVAAGSEGMVEINIVTHKTQEVVGK